MGFDDVAQRTVEILQGLTTVFPQKSCVTYGDWRVLDRGFDHSAVVFPADFQNTGTEMGPGSYIYSWKMNVELFQRWTPTAYADFAAFRDSVIQHLLQYPTLNALADTSVLPSMNGGDIREIFDKDGNGPFYLSQVITLQVNEIITVTLAE